MEKFIINNRSNLPKLLPYNSTGIELGVATGYFSEVLLQSEKFKILYSIDRWSDHHCINEYLNAAKRLSRYASKNVVLRSTFDESIKLFPESFFHFIYVDAYAHNGQESGTILDKWFPKLKKGGIFSGHDYEKAVEKYFSCGEQVCC